MLVSLACNVKGVHFTKEGGESKMVMMLECKISVPVAEMVNTLHAEFGKSDETKRKESVPLIKESTQFAPPRPRNQQQHQHSPHGRSEKPKSSTATPTIPHEVKGRFLNQLQRSLSQKRLPDTQGRPIGIM